MTVPVSTDPLPASILVGKVVGRVQHVTVDTTADTDDKPQAIPATGTVTLDPVADVLPALDGTSSINLLRTETLPLVNGYVADRGGHEYVWLPVGTYEVSFDLAPLADGAEAVEIDPFVITVTAAHTDAAPLELAGLITQQPPADAVVQTLVVPAGEGVLTRTGNTLSWGPGGSGGYSPPAGGIPEADLAVAVRNKINAAVTTTTFNTAVADLDSDIALALLRSQAVGERYWVGTGGVGSWSPRPTGYKRVEAYSDGTGTSSKDPQAPQPPDDLDGDGWTRALA